MNNPKDPSFEDISKAFSELEAEVAAPVAKSASPRAPKASEVAETPKTNSAYYDHSQVPSIRPGVVSGSVQSTTVVMKDADFIKHHHMQWCDETELGIYLARGFQFVKPEWVASSYTHALTGVGASQSDKVRIPVGFHKSGETRYNVLVFMPQELFAQIRTGEHNYYNDRLTAVNKGFNKASKNAGFKNPEGN